MKEQTPRSKVRTYSLEENMLSTRTDDVQWFDIEQDVEGDGTDPNTSVSRRKYSRSLETGEATDHRADGGWYAKSALTDEQKRRYNSYEGKDENIGDTRPRMYRVSLVAITVATLGLFFTMVLTTIAQGGWYVSVPARVLVPSIIGSVIVLTGAFYLMFTAGLRDYTKWKVWAGAVFSAVVFLTGMWGLSLFVFQFVGGNGHV